jgi:hypothetical protein
MLIARNFVFLHIPKTGGTFVQQTISDFMPVESPGRTHAPYSALPATARGLPGFYIVRNPWDWYVSFYQYWRKRGIAQDRARPWRQPYKRAVWEMMDSGRASFPEVTTRACLGEFDTAGLFPGLACAGLDLYSCYVHWVVGEALERDDYTALRYERLRRDLFLYLSDREGVDRDLLRAVRNDPPLRTSRHDPYPAYFDDRLRQLVGGKTSWICDRFGYGFQAGARADQRPPAASNHRPLAGSGKKRPGRAAVLTKRRRAL